MAFRRLRRVRPERSVRFPNAGLKIAESGYVLIVALALLHLARWLRFQLGEPGPPAECPPARITVISGSRAAS